MKRIAFFVQHMICGGIETALINLCKVLLKKDAILQYMLFLKPGNLLINCLQVLY